MALNDPAVLQRIIDERKNRTDPNASPQDFFELFVAEEVLKHYDLSYDDLELGNVEGGNDGGIDRIYCFVNGELISDDTDPDKFGQEPSITLHIIQAKTSTGFSEDAITTLDVTFKHLFDMSSTPQDYRARYNTELIEQVSNFRRMYLGLSPKFPSLDIFVHYATLGTHVHPNTETVVLVLDGTVNHLFSSKRFEFHFLTAQDLLSLVRTSSQSAATLDIVESPISTGDCNFICLVPLASFCSFISDQSGNLRHGIFESNVRDFQGGTEVNRAIEVTLRESDLSEDFWWLNNGVIPNSCVDVVKSGQTGGTRDGTARTAVCGGMARRGYRGGVAHGVPSRAGPCLAATGAGALAAAW